MSGAGRIILAIRPSEDPSARSGIMSQRVYESLQGKPEVSPLLTPRRYRMPPTLAPAGFTDVSPVLTLPLQAEATLSDRTRVRKSSALGSTCLAGL